MGSAFRRVAVLAIAGILAACASGTPVPRSPWVQVSLLRPIEIDADGLATPSR